MTFGHGSEIAEAERIVQASLDAGVTFFDTAGGDDKRTRDDARPLAILAPARSRCPH
jgi:hypothetical protein